MARTSKRTAALIIAVVTLAGACTDSMGPTRAPAAEVRATATPAQLAVSDGRGLDAEFTRLARQIPGFGGMYYDKSGTLNVYMVTPRNGAAALRREDVATQLRAYGGRAVQSHLMRGNALGAQSAATASIVVQQGAYDYLQLRAWKDRLTSIFKVHGVVYLDIDESANRLHVAVTPGASQQQVQKQLVLAGVPQAAVLITRMSPIKPVATLQDRLRPVPGGAQITFPLPSMPGFIGVCTAGFNARIPSSPGNTFFVTASHCSEVQGGAEGTPYFQPLPVSGNATANRVAVEFRDPRYGNPGGLCYTGFRCRLSDALLARYSSPSLADAGKIARTTFELQRIGSLIIDPQHPRWTVIDELPFPFEGDIADKVGRTSGWTSGPVVATCVDVQEAETDIVEICQDIVEAGVRPGDSGSSVFERVSSTSSDVLLTGALWGGGTLDNGAPVFVFSAMENIEFELGPLSTTANPLLATVR
jgi:hypothetical protein